MSSYLSAKALVLSRPLSGNRRADGGQEITGFGQAIRMLFALPGMIRHCKRLSALSVCSRLGGKFPLALITRALQVECRPWETGDAFRNHRACDSCPSLEPAFQRGCHEGALDSATTSG